jgi:hypothetical protein
MPAEAIQPCFKKQLREVFSVLAPYLAVQLVFVTAEPLLIRHLSKPLTYALCSAIAGAIVMALDRGRLSKRVSVIVVLAISVLIYSGTSILIALGKF